MALLCRGAYPGPIGVTQGLNCSLNSCARPVTRRICATLWSTLCQMGLCTRGPTLRGCRACVNKQRSIATIIGNSLNTLAKSAGICTPNLHSIPKTRSAVSTPYLPIMLLSNTRVMTNKVDELEGVFKLNDVDVAVITEAWMSSAVPDKCAHINGYCAFHKRRPLARGRGGGYCAAQEEHNPNQTSRY